MKCEVVREGQDCGNDAEFIVRTPWATQLACEDCSRSFKRFQTQKLEFFCDWPVGGEECGIEATYYFVGEKHHRPLCATHAVKLSSSESVHHLSDLGFNPKLVPYKPPVQPQPRVVASANGEAKFYCYCGKEGKYRGGVETMPLCDEHYTAPSKTKPPSFKPSRDFIHIATPASGDVRVALKDLALLTIRVLKEKIEKWR